MDTPGSRRGSPNQRVQVPKGLVRGTPLFLPGTVPVFFIFAFVFALSLVSQKERPKCFYPLPQGPTKCGSMRAALVGTEGIL